MDISKQVNMALTYAGVSKSELARRLSVTPANIGQKLKRGTFSTTDLDEIADAIGCKAEIRFVFPDGTTI